jgi:protein SCO1/2
MSSEAPVPTRAPRRSDEVLAVGALAFLLAVSAAWWWLALAPVGGDAPAWLQTARSICFGARENRLPNAGGWILLVGEPIGMVAALVIIAGGPLARGLRRLSEAPVGRVLLTGIAFALLAGIAAAGRTVMVSGSARAAQPAGRTSPRMVLSPVPDLDLVDEAGDTVRLERFRGRPILVTFAYGHCETVCPVLVHDALVAQRRLNGAPVVVVVTLDPWRDTPARLPWLARRWELGADAHVTSGDVHALGRVLARWGVQANRDPATGEVTHAPLTFIVDAQGRSAHATAGTVEEILRTVGARERVSETRR